MRHLIVLLALTAVIGCGNLEKKSVRIHMSEGDVSWNRFTGFKVHGEDVMIMTVPITAKPDAAFFKEIRSATQ